MSQLNMEKSDLGRVPAIPVPDGYLLRTFREGDEAGIARIYAASDLGATTAEAVREKMLGDPRFKPERLFVIEHQGELVGTAAAWVCSNDPSIGYLHMVGLLPGHRGKRLGAILTVAAINQNRAEGLSVQRLHTDDFREPALRLYLDLGYVPVYEDDTHPGRWETLARKLDRPEAVSHAIDRRPNQ
ncbi:MAG: GNAT family N-acetyltransferase [Candidatus Hydrogenedentes bacterium]|nr:GNAT family N-acetyltransferase [Candidatus Hydrogenedentota bacterium]